LIVYQAIALAAAVTAGLAISLGCGIGIESIPTGKLYERTLARIDPW
jgi:hypothetical protein